MTPKERIDFHVSGELPPLSLLVASGPYHTKDNLNYEDSALKDFAAVIKRAQPHAVILVILCDVLDLPEICIFSFLPVIV